MASLFFPQEILFLFSLSLTGSHFLFFSVDFPFLCLFLFVSRADTAELSFDKLLFSAYPCAASLFLCRQKADMLDFLLRKSTKNKDDRVAPCRSFPQRRCAKPVKTTVSTCGKPSCGKLFFLHLWKTQTIKREILMFLPGASDGKVLSHRLFPTFPHIHRFYFYYDYSI